MIRAALVLLVLSGCQQSRPAAAPPEARDDGKFVVRVVDEAGHPIAGVRVYAARATDIEEFGEVGSYDRRIGIGITDLFGIARFDRPRAPGRMMRVLEENLWAVAETTGWPAQTDDHGTIVLGPPRSVTGTIVRRAACTDEVSVALAAPWRPGTLGMPEPPPVRSAVPVNADDSFTFDGLGPGPYDVVVFGCGGNRFGIRPNAAAPRIVLPA